MRKIIIAGNWKMNKTPKEAVEFIENIKADIDTDKSDVVVCVPTIDIVQVAGGIKNSNILLGAQNMYFEDKGAYTGEISPLMLKETGVNYVLVGHSERREYFNETDEIVNKKVKKAIEHKIIPILCVGETLDQREQGINIEFVRIQVKKALMGIDKLSAKSIVIAYEPIWAIGTGRTASAQEAQEVCLSIRNVLSEVYDKETSDEIRILYGGSVNSSNARELFSMNDIDGGLVGGASLTDEFIKIVNY